MPLASRHAGAAATFWFRAEGSDTRPALTAGPAWARRRPVTPWLLREPPLTASLTLPRAHAGSIIARRDCLAAPPLRPSVYPLLLRLRAAFVCLHALFVWLNVTCTRDILLGTPQSTPIAPLGSPPIARAML